MGSQDEIILSKIRASQQEDGEVYLGKFQLTTEDVRIVAEYIKSPEASSIKKLSLYGNHQIGDEGGELLSAALCTSRYCRLVELDLSSTGIGTRCIQYLGEYLISPSSSLLTTLELSENALIRNNEVDIICSALAHNHRNLSSISLHGCNIGDEGALQIEFILENFNTTLSYIDLDGNPNLSKENSERVFSLVKNRNRRNIREYLPHIFNFAEIYRNIMEVYTYAWQLQIKSIATDIPEDILASKQLLEYLRPKYIPLLLQKLNLTIDIIPFDITTDYTIISYLSRISSLLQKNNFQISDIPQSEILNRRTLSYLELIDDALNRLQLGIISIPSHVKAKKQVLEYLQVLDIMTGLEITDQQIPKIFANSLSDKLEYLNELKRGKQSTKKLTLMVVGEEGVGKTSLIQHILSGKWVGDTFNGYDFKKVQKQEQKIPRTGITDGIDIHLYQPEGKDFIMNIYDFAGQEIYYSTHQFVLSSQAIYLLLFDASKSINANRIAHWIHTLSSVAPGASVFIIGTHFDQPSALQNLETNLSQLQSILDNIQFLTRSDRSLRFIFPFSFSKNLPSLLSEVVSIDELHKLPIWPISISPKSSSLSSLSLSLSLSSSSSSSLSSSSTSSLSELLQCVVTYAEESMKKTVVPLAWQEFRSFLFPQLLGSSLLSSPGLGEVDEYYDNADDLKLEIPDRSVIESTKEQLYREEGYQLGIMKERDIMKYAKELVGMKITSVRPFIQLLEYWGEIVYIPLTSSSSLQKFKDNLVILKPTLFISLCKQFITAKKLNASELHSFSYKLKKKILTKTSISSQSLLSDIKPHLLDLSQLHSSVQNIMNVYNLPSEKIKELVEVYIIPVLIDLKLIYPILVASHKTYVIPAMLRKPPSLAHIIEFRNHPLLSSSSLSSKLKRKVKSKTSRLRHDSSNEIIDDTQDNVVIIERRYEFIYLPSGMFTRLMMEVWNYFSLISSFSHNLQHEDMFWEDGFIITDHPHYNTSSDIKNDQRFDYQKYQLCIIQTLNYSGCKDGIGRLITLKISSPASKIGVILPIVHRAIINIIIQPLEFECGRNQSHIFCSATITPFFINRSNEPTQPTYYKYEDCFSALSNQVDSPPSELLRFLLPEYFNVSNYDQNINCSGDNDNNSTSELSTRILSTRYQDEVTEIKLLGEGAGGEVWYGYWHTFEVAIKKPRSQEIPSILNEISLLQSLHHPNVLKLLDVYYHSTPSSSVLSLAIITEYCREGDLPHIMLNQQGALHPIIICSIARDIAEGLSYLHNHSPPIIHCDIRPPNIFIKSLKLIDGEVCAVVGDVGFARVADRRTVSVGAKSIEDDVAGLLHIISLLGELLHRLPILINSEVSKIRDTVIQKFGEVTRMVIDLKYLIDPKVIANILSSYIIQPFYNNGNHDHSSSSPDIQRLFEIDDMMNRVLLPSPHFASIQPLLNPQLQTRKNALSLLVNCISQLSTIYYDNNDNNNNNQIKFEKQNMNENNCIRSSGNRSDTNNEFHHSEFWCAICRFVIPVIGYAIEQRVFTLDHLEQLDTIKYNYLDTSGDFEFGLTLFHYACRSANLLLVDKLCPNPNDINKPTYLPRSCSAAIHLAISSLKHKRNKKGFETTVQLLDYLLSHGANINLKDNKGETALIKAAMEGSYQIVVHLLNYPQHIDIHIHSNEHITAIVAAARYTSKNHLLCIKALLQMGSEYSPSLRNIITSDELDRIRSVANDLINDHSSAYARYPHATLAIYSWLES